MMTVRVSCILCESTVEVEARDVVLHLEGTDDCATNRYGFSCPSCSVYVVRPAGPSVVEALLATDVELSTGSTAPWEHATTTTVGLAPATEVTTGAPALTEADAEAFALQLADDHALSAWLEGAG